MDLYSINSSSSILKALRFAAMYVLLSLVFPAQVSQHPILQE